MASVFATTFLRMFSNYPRIGTSLLSSNPLKASSLQYLQQRRSYYTDWKMIRDVKRRAMCKEYARQRVRLNCIRKNRILPKAIRELADLEIAALPRDSASHRTVNRCVVTSRSRGVLVRWRLSRFIFRHLCDYNYMSGAQRAMW